MYVIVILLSTFNSMYIDIFFKSIFIQISRENIISFDRILRPNECCLKASEISIFEL